MKIKNNYLRLFIIIAVTTIAAITVYYSFSAIVDLLGYIISLFLPFILGYLYVSAVRPLMKFLGNKLKLPTWIGAIVVMIFTIGIIGGVVSLIIMRIFEEIRNVYTQFPVIYSNIEQTVINTKNQLLGLYYMLPENLQLSLQALGVDIASRFADFINMQSLPMISYAGATARALPKVFVGLVVFLLASFFMLSEPDRFTGMFRAAIPEGIKKKWRNVKYQIRNYLGGYIKAQGVIMLVAFCILFLGLSIQDVEFALIIAIGIAVLDALPFFGSGAVLWPWAIIRFINGNVKGGIALLVMYIIIVVTRQFIEPKIVSKKMGTNSLLTLMSMYVGFRTFSIGGMILGPVILLLFISFYKAGIFDGIIRAFRLIVRTVKGEVNIVLRKLREFGE